MVPFWYEQVDTDKLDVASPKWCIGGQVKEVWPVMEQVSAGKGEVPTDCARDHGLLLYVDEQGIVDGIDQYKLNYAILDRDWRAEISKRRQKGDGSERAE